MFGQRSIALIASSSRLVQQITKRNFLTTPALKQGIKHYVPNELEKRMLVWSGKYKNKTEIPSHVSVEEMERCRNKVRIRLANIMMALTVVGCCVMIYSGKQAQKRGESVTQQNLDWHKKYNEQQAAQTAKGN